MTTPTGEPRTPGGRTLKGFACWEFHALDMNAHNASCVRTLDLILAIEREAAAATEPRPDPALDVEQIVRQTLSIVDQTTPLSVGEPLVQRVLARLAGTASASETEGEPR